MLKANKFIQLPLLQETIIKLSSKNLYTEKVLVLLRRVRLIYSLLLRSFSLALKITNGTMNISFQVGHTEPG